MRGGAAGTAYTVSKHGVVGLTRSIAFHYGELGIRCQERAKEKKLKEQTYE